MIWESMISIEDSFVAPEAPDSMPNGSEDASKLWRLHPKC